MNQGYNYNSKKYLYDILTRNCFLFLLLFQVKEIIKMTLKREILTKIQLGVMFNNLEPV